jgi:hypothetical protein
MLRGDPRDRIHNRLKHPSRALLAMKGNHKSMDLVPEARKESSHYGTLIKTDRIRSPRKENPFWLPSDLPRLHITLRSHLRKRDDIDREPERLASLNRLLQLRSTTIDNEEIRKIPLLHSPFEPPIHNFIDRREIIRLSLLRDVEFAIGAFVRDSIEEDNYGPNDVRALEVGDINALHATRELTKASEIGQCLCNPIPSGILTVGARECVTSVELCDSNKPGL